METFNNSRRQRPNWPFGPSHWLPIKSLSGPWTQYLVPSCVVIASSRRSLTLGAEQGVRWARRVTKKVGLAAGAALLAVSCFSLAIVTSCLLDRRGPETSVGAQLRKEGLKPGHPVVIRAGFYHDRPGGGGDKPLHQCVPAVRLSFQPNHKVLPAQYAIDPASSASPPIDIHHQLLSCCLCRSGDRVFGDYPFIYWALRDTKCMMDTWALDPATGQDSASSAVLRPMTGSKAVDEFPSGGCPRLQALA